MGLTMANRYTSTEVMKATDLFGSILLSSLICQVGQFRFHFVKDYLPFFISANLIIYDKTNDNSNIEKNNSVAVMKSVQANKITMGNHFESMILFFLIIYLINILNLLFGHHCPILKPDLELSLGATKLVDQTISILQCIVR